MQNWIFQHILPNLLAMNFVTFVSMYLNISVHVYTHVCAHIHTILTEEDTDLKVKGIT